MRKVNLILVLVLLASPVAASAKVGVELDKNATTLAPGEKTGMTIMLYREPRDPGSEPSPVIGERALVTFTNAATGDVVRVRARRTNSEGIATATVAFPARGRWAVDISGVEGVLDEGVQELAIGQQGTGSLPPETVAPPTPATAPAADDAGSLPTLPAIVVLALLALGAGVLLVRRRQEGAA